MMKTDIRVVSFLLIALLLLPACQTRGPAAATSTPPATQAPVEPTAPPEPTDPPATETPEPTETAEPTETPEPSPTVVPTETPEPEPPTPEGPASVDEGALELGETSRGAIDEPGASSNWTVEAAAEDVIYATAETVRGDMVPVMTLLDEEGFTLATSTESGESGATLQTTIEDDGTYTLQVTALRRGTGTYELTAYNAKSAAGEIEYGDTVEGFSIGGVTEDRWTFTGSAGDFVDVEVEGEEGLDTYIRIEDEEGTSIAQNDDRASGEVDPLLTSIPIPQDGDYTIVVASYSFSGAGGYELTLNQGEPPAGGEIAYGDTVTEELGAGQRHVWTFEGTQGDVVNIAANATGEEPTLDIRIALNGPDGNELASDDDSGGNRNALIAAAELPETGTYTIYVFPYSGEGPYELTLESGEEPEAMTPIAIDQTVDGEITSDQPQVWTLDAQQGDVINIAVNAGEGTGLDPRVWIQDPDGTQIAYDDDSGGDRNSLISEFTLPTTGTYFIAVNAFGGLEGGYNLTVTQGDGTTEG
ncbi:MAG TPA: pre-peptidase C-terminal domain-containing protein [Ardenticatenaceae bacterium]|nr:pre-peptidase C-terminal domain-containing protein [Ardenticatenaceae bacterium]